MKIWIVSYRDKCVRNPNSETGKTIPCASENLAHREAIKLLEENFILHRPWNLGEAFGNRYEDLFKQHDYPAMLALYQKMVPWGPTVLVETVELVES